jgi:hypothetical protein
MTVQRSRSPKQAWKKQTLPQKYPLAPTTPALDIRHESSARADHVPALCRHRPSLPIEWLGEAFGLAQGSWQRLTTASVGLSPAPSLVSARATLRRIASSFLSPAILWHAANAKYRPRWPVHQASPARPRPPQRRFEQWTSEQLDWYLAMQHGTLQLMQTQGSTLFWQWVSVRIFFIHSDNGQSCNCWRHGGWWASPAPGVVESALVPAAAPAPARPLAASLAVVLRGLLFFYRWVSVFWLRRCVTNCDIGSSCSRHGPHNTRPPAQSFVTEPHNSTLNVPNNGRRSYVVVCTTHPSGKSGPVLVGERNWQNMPWAEGSHHCWKPTDGPGSSQLAKTASIPPNSEQTIPEKVKT